MAETVLGIEGMSCGHCVQTITKALKAIPGVESADVSLDSKSATVRHDGTVAESAMVKAIEEEGYDVTPAGGSAR